MSVPKTGVVLVLLSVLCLAGCNNADAKFKKVTGKVTYKGEAVADAGILFIPKEHAEGKEGGGGRTLKDGSFLITSGSAKTEGSGLLPGEYIVTIMKREEMVDPDQQAYDEGKIDYDELQNRRTKTGGESAPQVLGKTLIPVKYSQIHTSGLVAIVTDNASENVFNYVLED
jgi:hypothetical protein